MNKSLIHTRHPYLPIFPDDFQYPNTLRWKSLDCFICIIFKPIDGVSWRLEMSEGSYATVIERSLPVLKFESSIVDLRRLVRAIETYAREVSQPNWKLALQTLMWCSVLLKSYYRDWASSESLVTFDNLLRTYVESRSLSYSKVLHCDILLDVNCKLEEFLRGLNHIVLAATLSSESYRSLQLFHCFLLFFIVRCIIRSTLRYSNHDLVPESHLADQDTFLGDGHKDTVYDHISLALQSWKLTFGEILGSGKLLLTEAKLYRCYGEATTLIPIPDPMNATPMEHIRYFARLLSPA